MLLLLYFWVVPECIYLRFQGVLWDLRLKKDLGRKWNQTRNLGVIFVVQSRIISIMRGGLRGRYNRLSGGGFSHWDYY